MQESFIQGAIDYQNLLSALYSDLAMRPLKSAWMQPLMQLFQLDSAVVILENTASRTIHFVSAIGAARDSIEYPAGHRAQALWQLDPGADLPSRRAIALDRHLLQGDLQRRHFFQRCLQPFGLASLLCLNIDGRAGRRICLRLGRVERRQPFSAAELHLLEGLSLHLQRAFCPAEENLEHGEDAAVLQRLLDNLRGGMAVFDQRRRLLAINAAGIAAFRQIPGLALSTAPLQLGGAERLHGLFKPFDGPAGAGAVAVFSADCGTARPPLRFVTRLLPGAPDAGHEPRLLVVACGGPALPCVDLHPLQALFGFSPSEARVAALLASGVSIDTAAQLLYKSRNTIRSHARAIYEKAGVDNQAQLSALILTSPASLLA